MYINNIYYKLKFLKAQIEKMEEESFDKTKAFKLVKNSILDLVDELSFLDKETELLDDNNDQIENKDSDNDLIDEFD